MSAAAATAAASQSLRADTGIPKDLVEAWDKGVERMLQQQVTGASSKYRGALPDADGLHAPGAIAGLIQILGTTYLHDGSKFHKHAELLERIRLGVGFVNRGLSKDGNIYLPITNFNSTPDGGFFVNPVATVALLARRAGAAELSKEIEPLLRTMGGGLAKGGVHTPNHRWVVSSALAQLYELFGDASYRKRVDQWLAEGIDMDADGQFSERSTTVYNTVCDKALVIIANKMKRPELFEHVRRNLDALEYLVHPGGEVVTEFSKRQDRNQRAKLDRYWFPLQYMSGADQNGRYEAMARLAAPGRDLSLLIEYPELRREVAPAALNENFLKTFPVVGVTRIRRGFTSATIHHKENDRFFSVRRGDVVINAVRFASAFFGKGQFVASYGVNRGGTFELTQELEGPYYQPLEKPETIVYHEQWSDSRKRRKRTEVCKLRQSAIITEDKNGFSVRMQSSGTNEVPLAVEISFAPGGTLEGCEKLRDDVHLLAEASGVYRVGSNAIRFGPGLKMHRYVNVRGALPKLEGTSVYLTGLTPFDHTLRFDWA